MHDDAARMVARGRIETVGETRHRPAQDSTDFTSIPSHTSSGKWWRGVKSLSSGLAVASRPHFEVNPSSPDVEGSRSEPRALLMMVMSRSGAPEARRWLC